MGLYRLHAVSGLQEHLKCGLLIFMGPTLPHSGEAGFSSRPGPSDSQLPSPSWNGMLFMSQALWLHGREALAVLTALGTDHGKDALTGEHEVSDPMWIYHSFLSFSVLYVFFF